MAGARLEIHFHLQDEVSVSLDSTETGDVVRETELLLFALYAARQVLTLGNTHGFGLSLAAVLLHAGESPDSLLRDGPGGVHLVPSPGVPGRRRYRASLEYTTFEDPAGIHFRLSPVGFGVLGGGVGYYAPSSVLALLYHLLREREADPAYVAGLAAAARHLGSMLPHAGAASQLALALNAAAIGRGELLRALAAGGADAASLDAATARFRLLWQAGEAPQAEVGEALATAARSLLEPGEARPGKDGDPRLGVYELTALGGYRWRQAEGGERDPLRRELARSALAAVRHDADDAVNLFAAGRQCVIDGVPFSWGSPCGSAALLEAGYRRLVEEILTPEALALVDRRLLRVAFSFGVAVHDVAELLTLEPSLAEALRSKRRHRSFRLTREADAATLASTRWAPEHRSFRLTR